MAGGPIIPGEDDTLFTEPLLADTPADVTAPDYLDRRDMEPMDDEEFGSLVDGGVSAAENFVDTELSPARELAARYYRGVGARGGGGGVRLLNFGAPRASARARAGRPVLSRRAVRQ